MALRFVDSFMHSSIGDFTVAGGLSSKWTAAGSSGNVEIASGVGRWGGAAFHSNGNAGTIQKTIDAQQTWILGAAIDLLTAAATTTIMAVIDGATTQVDVRLVTGSQVLEVTRNGTVLAVGTVALVVGTFYYIELKTKIDNTTGTTEVHINGVADAALTLTGQDTQATANATANVVQIGSGNASTKFYASDFYACDGTGGSPTNTFLGDTRVQPLYPNGNGNSSQFTGSDGNSTDNYLLVDDTTPNGDTDYVEDATVTDKDTYAFQDPTPTTGTVYGVQINHYSRKTDAGTRSLRSLARLSGTETDNGVDQALSTSYQNFADIRETKPGGGAWTLADVSNAEFGQKVAA